MSLENENRYLNYRLLLGLIITAITLPIVSYLAQNSQDNRNRAAYDCSQQSKPPSETCNTGWSCNTSSGLWQCKASPSPTVFSFDLVGTIPPTPTPYKIDLAGPGFLIPTNTPIPNRITIKPNPTVYSKKRGVFRFFFK
jgi:hypothetical protein